MIGHLQMITIYVSDLRRALDFYTQKLGFVKTAAFDDGVTKLVWVVPAPALAVDRATEIALCEAAAGDPRVGATSGIVFTADDIETTYRELKERGVHFMKRKLFLIHWNPKEAEVHVGELQDYGWDVVGVESEDGARAYQQVRDNPPDALVIYLSRRPSHGRQTAVALRQLKATRSLPIVFVGGKEAAITATREKVPDAVYVEPAALVSALNEVTIGAAGHKDEKLKTRCAWAGAEPLYLAYHDEEWGVPVHDDHTLFELLILEGAQAGLSWSTILNKRENYRRAFDNFDAQKIAAYDDAKVVELLNDSGIVRNRLKIRAAVQNAQAFLALQAAFGSFDAYVWQFVGGQPKQNAWQSLAEIPAQTAESEAMSKDLRKRGFNFVGPTICYAFMQATGMVNDHTVDCFRYEELRAA